MSLSLTRVINGKAVSDEEIPEYIITNEHVIGILYRAQRRIAENLRKISPDKSINVKG